MCINKKHREMCTVFIGKGQKEILLNGLILIFGDRNTCCFYFPLSASLKNFNSMDYFYNLFSKINEVNRKETSNGRSSQSEGPLPEWGVGKCWPMGPGAQGPSLQLWGGWEAGAGAHLSRPSIFHYKPVGWPLAKMS